MVEFLKGLHSTRSFRTLSFRTRSFRTRSFRTRSLRTRSFRNVVFVQVYIILTGLLNLFSFLSIFCKFRAAFSTLDS